MKISIVPIRRIFYPEKNTDFKFLKDEVCQVRHETLCIYTHTQSLYCLCARVQSHFFTRDTPNV